MRQRSLSSNAPHYPRNTNPTKRAILPEKSEKCVKTFTILYLTFLKENLSLFCTNLFNILHKSSPHFVQIVSIFCRNSFRFSWRLLWEMFGRRRDRLQTMGSLGGDGRKSLRFLWRNIFKYSEEIFSNILKKHF